MLSRSCILHRLLRYHFRWVIATVTTVSYASCHLRRISFDWRGLVDVLSHHWVVMIDWARAFEFHPCGEGTGAASGGRAQEPLSRKSWVHRVAHLEVPPLATYFSTPTTVSTLRYCNCSDTMCDFLIGEACARIEVAPIRKSCREAWWLSHVELRSMNECNWDESKVERRGCSETMKGF
jgi:hypothetical protein